MAPSLMVRSICGNPHRVPYRLHRLVAALACAPGLWALQAPAHAESAPTLAKAEATTVAYEFSPDLLAGGVGSQLDLSRFAKGNPQLTGVYRADIYLNGRWVLRRDVRLAGNPAVPCIDPDVLGLLGLGAAALTAEGQAVLGPSAARGRTQACSSIEGLTKDAHAAFDAGELRLDITVPQASLARQPKGYVPPESWDYGVNAALLGYNLNAFRTSGVNGESTSVFAGLNGGLNLGRWRLRHSGSYNRSSGGGSRYDEFATYVATDLPDWKSSLTIGDAYTTGQLFPSFRLRGVGLAKDGRMLPDSQRGYAPVIRGVAGSNAKVEIKQNNVLLYSTSVPPGPFEINDLYPTGYGGDLQVVVTEADGTQKMTSVPFSSLPQLLREGTLDYSISAGQLLGYTRRYEVLQGTVQYGLSNELTLDGGVLAARGYTSALVGAAWNTVAGAFQLNATEASFERSAYQRYNGWSLDGSWAKVFQNTLTNLNFAAYRYSSSGYYSLDDAMRRLDIDAASSIGAASPGFRTKNRAVVSINQTLASGLLLYLRATSQDYWDYGGRQTAYQLGLNQQIGQVQLSFNATSTRFPLGGPAQNAYTVGLTMPLGGPTTTVRNNVSAFATHDSVTGDVQQLGLFGSYGERGELSYGVSDQNSRLGNTLSASTSYHAKFATVGATMATGRGISQQSLSASVGIVGADGHLIFAPFLGDTIGLVHVSGAEGLQIAASQASEIDADGYTLLPYLSPYSANPVELNVSKAPLSARFDSIGTVVAPHAGSVVLVQFKRLPGYTLMLSARRNDGSAVPFGASVYDRNGLLVGNVGQAGRVEAASESLTGSLRVSWGEDARASCWIHYRLPKPSSGDESLLQANVICQPGTLPTLQADSGAAGEHVRKPYLLFVKDTQGQSLPKGAEVSLADDPDRVGVVGDGGRAVLSLRIEESATARLVARWSDEGGQSRQCVLVRQAATMPATPMSARGEADAITSACPVEMTRFNAGAAPETALAEPAAAGSLAQWGN